VRQEWQVEEIGAASVANLQRTGKEAGGRGHGHGQLVALKKPLAGARARRHGRCGAGITLVPDKQLPLPLPTTGSWPMLLSRP